jgi:hypothetical protein
MRKNDLLQKLIEFIGHFLSCGITVDKLYRKAEV